MPAIDFFLVRHGQTDWNVQRRLQGSNDIPLNDTGRMQACALRLFFGRQKIDTWFSSPLSRAKETLLLAGQIPPEKLIVDRDLSEVGLGELEGLAQDEVIRKFGADLWSRWSTIAPDGGDFAFPGAESPRESNERLESCLRRLAAQHRFQTAAVCTHGFLIRRFVQRLDPVEPPRIIPNGLIARIRLENDAFSLRELKELGSMPEE